MKRIFSLFLLLCSCILLTNVNGALITNNIDYLKLDIDNINQVDSTGNQNADIVGATFTNKGLINSAYSCDGINDYIDTNYALNSNQISISFWINNSFTGNPTVPMYPFGITDGSGSSIFLLANTDGSYLFRWRISSVNRDVTFTPSLNPGFNHFFMTIDTTTNNLEIFFNGVSQGTNINTLNSHTFTADSWFGTRNNGGVSLSPYNGVIDEISIWTDIKGQTEINDIYNSGIGLQYPYITGSTPEITNDVQPFYNSTNISINLITTTNVNMSYALDNEDLIINDSLVAYYQAENNSNDRLGLHNGTWSGTEAYINSLNNYGNAFDFDGASTIGISSLSVDNNWSISTWIYFDDRSRHSLMGDNSATKGYIYLNNIDSNDLKLFYEPSSIDISCAISSNLVNTLDTWYHITVIGDNNDNIQYYVNGIYEGNCSTSDLDLNLLYIGRGYTGIVGSYINGNVDELRVYNRTIISTEITTLYTTSPYANICNNCNSSILNLTALTEQGHVILFYASDVNGVSVVTNSFTIDLTPPHIEFIGNITQDTFIVDFSTIFNVTDTSSGVDTCTLNITYLENVTNSSQFDSFINCTDTGVFSAPGLYNGFLEARDNAGNLNTTSINGTINPVVEVKFNDTLIPALVKDYSVTIAHPGGFIENKNDINGSIFISPVENDTLDLGIHNITFFKIGYSAEIFQLNVSADSAGELVIFNLSQSEIVLSIFNKGTGNLLTGLSTITLVATTGFNGTTTTGLLNISDINFINEPYQIIVSHSNFTTESVYFNYDNQETLIVDIYLLDTTQSNAGIVTIHAVADSGELIQGAVCKALEWVSSSSSFISVSQGLTNINGDTNLPIELGTKLYKFSCSKAGVTVLSNQQIIQVTGTIIPITMPTSFTVPVPTLLSTTGVLTNSTLNETHQRIIFTYEDTAGTVSEGCIGVYKKVGIVETLLSNTCSQSSQGQIQVIININQSFNTLVKGTVEVDSIKTTMDTILFKVDQSIEQGLKQYGIDILIPILFIFLGIAIGFMIDPENIFISMIGAFIGVWSSFLLISSRISFSIAMFVTIILAFMFQGGNKRK